MKTNKFDATGEEIETGFTVAPGGKRQHAFKVELKDGALGGENKDGKWVHLYKCNDLLITRRPRVKKNRIPKNIGACADKLYSTRQRRLALQHEADALKKFETELNAHIIDTLPKSEASGVAGRLARVTVVTKEVPSITDQQELRDYVIANDRWDLVNNLRASSPAIRDMWEEGVEIPGVEKFGQISVSLNKL